MTSKWVPSVLSQADEDIPQDVSEGDVLSLDRVEQGERSCTTIYISPHLMERKKVFDEFVASKRFKQLYIAGPPGCGKTLFISLLVRMYAKKENKRVLFVAYRDKGKCLVFVFQGRNVQQLSAHTSKENLFDVLTGLTDKEHFDMVVYDGVRDSIPQSSGVLSLLNEQVEDSKISKVLHVTSLAFRIKDGDVLPYYLRIHQLDYFDSWERGIYTDAIHKMFISGKLKQWLEQEIKDSAGSSDESSTTQNNDSDMPAMIESYVDFKYFYAGGSARFMFDYNVEDLRGYLQGLIEALKDDQWQALTSSVPSMTDDAVNTLMQRFRDRHGLAKCAPVSRYIAMIAYEKCGEKVVTAVSTAATRTGNPSLKGWAFELQQLEIIKKGFHPTPSSTHIFSDSGLAFLPTRQVHFDGTNLEGNIDGTNLEGNVDVPQTTVVWCLKWDQGCFDVALYSKPVLVTLQFTVSETHSLKLEYVRELREAFSSRGINVETVAHIGINEDGQLHWKSATGTGRGNCEVDFTIQLNTSSPLKASSMPYNPNAARLLLPNGTPVEMHNNKRKAPGAGLS